MKFLNEKEPNEILYKRFMMLHFRTNQPCSPLFAMEAFLRNIKRPFLLYNDDSHYLTAQNSGTTNFRQALRTIRSRAINSFVKSRPRNGTLVV